MATILSLILVETKGLAPQKQVFVITPVWQTARAIAVWSAWFGGELSYVFQADYPSVLVP